MAHSSWYRFQLTFKCAVSYLFLPLGIALVWPFLYLIMRYRIRDLGLVRRRFAHLIKDKEKEPILVCLNHLTRIDSLILAFVCVPIGQFFTHYSLMMWHVLDFGRLQPFRILCAFVKTIAITRMGDRNNIRLMQEKVKYLLLKGNLVVIFPEGTRSKSGRVDTQNFQYGAGSIIRDLPGCRVLCAYVRADKQVISGHVPPLGPLSILPLS